MLFEMELLITVLAVRWLDDQVMATASLGMESPINSHVSHYAINCQSLAVYVALCSYMY